MTIYHYTTFDSAAIWWDKQEYTFYVIKVNGSEAGKTTKTHFEFEELLSDKEYYIEILSFNNEKDAKEAEKTDLTFRTKKAKNKIDITKAPYNAVGDRKTMNTAAIQKALDDCDAESYVYVPEGIFLTGGLRMHSDTELIVSEKGVIQGTADEKDYLPKIKSRFEGTEMMCYSSLINMGELDRNGGFSAENIIIRGKGTIAGGGQKLANRIIEVETENLKDYMASLGEKLKECETEHTIPGRLRGRLINMSNARNIVVANVRLREGASWNVHMIYCENIVTHGVDLYSRGVWNGDGWDPDSSTNCTLFGTSFYTGDDSVAVKSGKKPEGNIVNKPTRNIKVFDCVCTWGHGIAIGSEMSGGVDGVYIWDCDLENSAYGVLVKGTRKRGGYVKNIEVTDCILPRVEIASVNYNDDGEAAPTAPVFSDFRYKNLTLTGYALNFFKDIHEYVNPIEITGFGENGFDIKNISFEGISMKPHIG